ncbi:COLEC12 [Mytilus edulis]|uniref:COLEC12 n=1 Tax=Mytilus edulis TaxID=6550 RepID=A0A8S3RGL5_MYTED|nr:COLEC12 [Mytilus edulis]
MNNTQTHSKCSNFQHISIVKVSATIYANSRCPSDIDGFMHYRHLDLCYNFNPEHYIDYLGHIKQTCSSYGGELLRIDSQERQTYIEHILEGRTASRVAIQGHSNNPGNAWTLDDGTQLPYTNWRSGDPRLIGFTPRHRRLKSDAVPTLFACNQGLRDDSNSQTRKRVLHEMPLPIGNWVNDNRGNSVMTESKENNIPQKKTKHVVKAVEEKVNVLVSILSFFCYFTRDFGEPLDEAGFVTTYNDLDNIRNLRTYHVIKQVLKGSRCPSDIDGFMYYRHLDLRYNFNPEHYVDYPGHIQPKYSLYGGELLRIDSQERQTYIEHILEGRTTIRVAIQGHSYNPSFAWTLDDGALLPFTPWCSEHH